MAGTWRRRNDYEETDLRFERSNGRSNYRAQLNSLVDELNSNDDAWDDEDYWEAKERNLLK